MTEQSANNQKKLDVNSLFPSKGDPRRPPEWYGRALFYAVIAVYLGWFAFTSWGKITYIVFDIIIALFLALAVEPLVIRLIKHGWKRAVASVTCLVGLLVIVVVLLGLFGNMFVQQLISMVRGLPDLYNQFAALIAEKTQFKLPEMNDLGGEIMKNVKGSWVTDFAGQAVSTTMGVLGQILNFTTAIMVALYISIAGTKLRRSLCQWIAPHSQRRFLMVWTVVQGQISGFLFSRSILAAINAACTAAFLMIIKVPYWLPLALFCGVVSQFVPTLGTYIGGALPVMFAWGERGLGYGIGVVVFITVYQQIENLLLSPKISERTMDLNPCIAFLTVLLFGSLFGALGAFLALPITASIQVLLKVSMKRYPLVDMPLMNDPKPKKKSKMVEAADAINEHVIKPVSDRIPRQAKGSSGHVTFDDQIKELQHQVYDYPDDAAQPVSEDSPTVAIPKNVFDAQHTPHGSGLDALRAQSADAAGAAHDEDGHPGASGEDSADAGKDSATDNPRSRWR